jgi:hypothetical protein
VGQVTNLLENEVHTIANRTVSVQKELERTLAESRRVVEAIQRHWLIRKYVDDEDDRLPLLPGYPVFDAAEAVQADLMGALSESRLSADAEGIVRDAYNLAVYALSVDQRDLAQSLLYEALVAARQLPEVPFEVWLLQSELYRISGHLDVARESADQALAVALDAGKKGRASTVQARLMLSALALAQDDLAGAKQFLDDARRTRGDTLDDSLFKAALLGLEAKIAFSEGKLRVAGDYYLQQSQQFRSHQAFGPMVVAMIRSADLFYNAGDYMIASEQYLRAAASLLAQRDSARSRAVLQLAGNAANAAEDEILQRRVTDLMTELDQ